MSATEVTLHQGDCLELIPKMTQQSVSLCFSDLPYGVFKNAHWDVPLNCEKLWDTLRHVLAEGAQTILTASQPFATYLISSNLKNFRYDLIWKKKRCTGFFQAKRAPLRAHEHILVFGQTGYYAPQMADGKKLSITSSHNNSSLFGEHKKRNVIAYTGSQRYPKSIVEVDEEDMRTDTLNGRKPTRFHPTQKPVALVQYLIETYTNKGDTILDPCAGSGTTAIAAINVGDRKVICIEKDPAYFGVMQKRVAEHQAMLGAS